MPAKVIVVGAGVAGLAAIQQAKGMNANVYGFDVRAAAAEQVEAMGAKFLSVELDEDGSADGGYAKEMSAEWFEAAEQMLLKECADTNVIITTALIPGKAAPVLISQAMVDAMPPGSVTCDLAASNGGNVAVTKPGETYKYADKTTVIGHDNWPAQMGNIASAMFGGNVTKLLLSMDYDGEYKVNLEDTAVRSMCVANAGELLEPYVPPPPVPKTEDELAAEEAALPPPPDPEGDTMSSVKTYSGTGAGALAMASFVPDPGMMSTFALSVWVGTGAVQGVAHALHSPLMSVTNAISGMTMVGGMLQLGGGMMPSTAPQYLATTAVTLSAVNLAGGFIITNKMLDMFRRPDDPPEFFHYYLIPPAAAAGVFSLATLSGAAPQGMAPAMALMSGIGCIAGISSMSSQESSRMSTFLAQGGVGVGLVTTLMAMNPESSATYGQLALFSAIGGGIGYGIAGQVGPTQLPQAVAGFHSLVGIAAASTAIGDFLVHDISHMDGFTAGSLYMGAWMGSITCTGSIIAYGKLAELMNSNPLALPGRDVANMAMGAGSIAAGVGFCLTNDNATAGTCLAAGTTFSGLLGFHMTASIGGADMPVVITLLNSYSGWALCAEGFILNQPVLTIVGSLIGSSGAFLTKIMCDGMNRSLTNVILGGFGAEAGVVQTSEGLVHTEIVADGVAESLLAAENVCIVPGYGLVVAQAQGTVAGIANSLTAQGKTVKFAVHPVAGRMPGQLNVLLAEAGVPYDQVLEMEEINEVMEDQDVSMVVGANDTVNSAAETDPNCDIAGMPVIQVWKSQQVVFFKRSMASGYAGVDNPVFYNENTDMCLGNVRPTAAALESIYRPLSYVLSPLSRLFTLVANWHAMTLTCVCVVLLQAADTCVDILAGVKAGEK
jgi:NAD(P) transhydrogenase